MMNRGDPIEIGTGWGRAPVECPECSHEKHVRLANVIYECPKCGTQFVVRWDGGRYPNGTPMAMAERAILRAGAAR